MSKSLLAGFEGGKTYRLRVPPNAPVEQYWSVTAYDRQTHALIKGMSRASRSSNAAEVQRNADESIDVYFAPQRLSERSRTGCRPTPSTASS